MNELQDYIDYLEFRLETAVHGTLEFEELEIELTTAEYDLAQQYEDQ